MPRVWIYQVPPEEHGTVNALSFYRAAGPWSKIHRLSPDIQVTVARQGDLVDHVSMEEFDICFIQRPITQATVGMIDYLKRLGKKIVLDYDDNLFAIPKCNPTYDLYNDQRTQDAIKMSLGLADCVTTTTSYLADVLRKYNGNVTVIPNALDDYLFRKSPCPVRKNVVTWRGAMGHDDDLYEFREPIIEVMKANPDWTIKFFGCYPPKFIRDEITNYEYQGPLDMFGYMEELRKTAAKVHICPLIDNEFNRCKSNISFIEGSWAGSICVGPDWWGCKNHYGDDSLTTLFSALGSTLEFCDHLHKESYPKLSDVNWERVKLVKRLMEG